MEIRPIEDGDVDAVVALWEVCDLLRPWNEPQADIARARAAPQSEIFVMADVDGAIIASAMAGDDGHRAWSSPVYLRFDAEAAKRAAERRAKEEEESDEPSP